MLRSRAAADAARIPLNSVIYVELADGPSQFETYDRRLGIDPGQTFVDHSGRPRYILEERGIIHEVV